jgi:hypothetical protein
METFKDFRKSGSLKISSGLDSVKLSLACPNHATLLSSGPAAGPHQPGVRAALRLSVAPRTSKPMVC